MNRAAAVAGHFYPGDATALKRQIAECLPREDSARSKREAIACLVPHAGYVYSGRVAGAVYGAIQMPRRCILLGPRHFPRGAPLAIWPEGEWETPLGAAAVDAELARQIQHVCPLLRADPAAHEREHSLEVQLPFLQVLARQAGNEGPPAFRFVPIVLATDRYPAIKGLGRALANVISRERDGAAGTEGILLIASSDMNHYEPDEITRAKDGLAIEQLRALDPRGLYDAVRLNEISMCGYAAAAAMLVAARELGATRAELIRYATSFDALSRSEAIPGAKGRGGAEGSVGYAGMIFTR